MSKFPIYRKQVKSSRRSFDLNNKRGYYRNVYLNSDHWHNLRKEKLEQHSVCEECKSTIYLDVHHKDYRSLYDVKLSDLQILCRDCHESLHKKLNKKKYIRNKKKNFRRGLQYAKVCRKFKWSKNPIVRFHIMKWILQRLIKICRNKHIRYAFNVKKSKNHIDITLTTNLYARSKIYNEYHKMIIR